MEIKRIRKNLAYLIIVFGVYPAATLVLAWLLGRMALGRAMLLCQCVVMACAAPFFASANDASQPIYSMMAAALKTLGLVVASLIAAAVMFAVIGGKLPVPWLMKSAGILAGFGLLLVGANRLAMRLGAGVLGAQLAAYAVAALMLGTVFYANPAVAAARGQAKIAVVQAAVIGNPLICLAGSAADYDILLSRSLYDISLIGPDHLYRYPAWWAVSLIYAVIGIAMAAASAVRKPGLATAT